MLLAQTLVAAWLLSLALPRRRHWIAAAVGLLALLPIDGLSAAMALRALWGDPSVTSLQLLALALLGRAPTAFTRDWRGPAGIAAIAAVFYPLALGLSDFDPYRLGYQPGLLLAALALPALFLCWRGNPLWLWLLSIDLAAWAGGLLESPNLWDTLLDPLLAVACLALALRNGWRTYKKNTP
ncbi:MAG: hypothetical protein M0P39_05070 [Rhodocyclaceae bacterium]|jgi:hypothetical protein|nr:hypothetical protein [Rhodocyclaceae bacterium]